MTDFAILAPQLPEEDARLLRVAVQHARLDWSPPVDTLPTNTRFVLSVGRAALDIWHDFGLVQVGVNHGDVFTHRQPTTGRTFVIMVVEHPSAMRQLSAFGKYGAREDMVRDLRRWRLVLEGHDGVAIPGNCGGCMRLRERRIRPAEFWVDELDGVGLCDDHYRRRIKYNRKKRVVPVKDRGKPEHQIEGQGEMFADGMTVMVSKT